MCPSGTVVTTWLVMALLIAFGIAVSRRMRRVPSGPQLVAEVYLGLISAMLEDTMGPAGLAYLPFVATVGMFVLLSNLLGALPGLASPTADLSTTAALALAVFFMSQAAAVRAKGFRAYLLSFVRPFWWMLPLNLVGLVARPVSQAFRLYGNMVGGVIIVGIVFQAARWILPVPVIGWFNVFTGVVQGAVFTLLSIVYIADAVQ